VNKFVLSTMAHFLRAAYCDPNKPKKIDAQIDVARPFNRPTIVTVTEFFDNGSVNSNPLSSSEWPVENTVFEEAWRKVFVYGVTDGSGRISRNKFSITRRGITTLLSLEEKEWEKERSETATLSPEELVEQLLKVSTEDAREKKDPRIKSALCAGLIHPKAHSLRTEMTRRLLLIPKMTEPEAHGWVRQLEEVAMQSDSQIFKGKLARLLEFVPENVQV